MLPVIPSGAEVKKRVGATPPLPASASMACSGTTLPSTDSSSLKMGSKINPEKLRRQT
jgi:hypothetical protein